MACAQPAHIRRFETARYRDHVPIESTARIEAVYFDIGETLLDRTREYAAWARWLDVPAHTFSAVFGAVIASGGTVGDVIARFTPGDTRSFQDKRAEIDQLRLLPTLGEIDLYSDVRATLSQLRGLGLRIGIAGNQPAGIGEQLRALELPADDSLTSTESGVAKPAAEFFEDVQRSAGVPMNAIVYVGDQLDNDVLPAVRAGMQAVRILRGPWGYLDRDIDAEASCLAVVRSLSELPTLLAG
jgi:FMN phosphatase YigB (HAD superfamily)